MKLDILLPSNGNRNFQDARKPIQQALFPTDTDDAPPHEQGPNSNATTIAIDKLTKGLQHLSVSNTKTTPTVATRWLYQLDKLMQLYNVT